MTTEKLAVLIVEDSKPIQDLLLSALESADCEVTVAGRVTDAMVALETSQFDLALVDLNLGDGRTGWEILEAHRRNTDPLFVVLSGSHDPSDAERAMACGAPYLLKPASPSQMATVLQAALKRRELSKEGRRQRDR